MKSKDENNKKQNTLSENFQIPIEKIVERGKIDITNFCLLKLYIKKSKT